MQCKYQVTLFCSTGQYRPVASIVTIEQKEDIDLSKDKKLRQPIIQKGIERICLKRYWSGVDVKKYHYNNCKIRKITVDK